MFFCATAAQNMCNAFVAHHAVQWSVLLKLRFMHPSQHQDTRDMAMCWQQAPAGSPDSTSFPIPGFCIIWSQDFWRFIWSNKTMISKTFIKRYMDGTIKCCRTNTVLLKVQVEPELNASGGCQRMFWIIFSDFKNVSNFSHRAPCILVWMMASAVFHFVCHCFSLETSNL